MERLLGSLARTLERCEQLLAQIARNTAPPAPAHPSENWCKHIVTKTGWRCTNDAAADELCRTHWRRQETTRQAQAAASSSPVGRSNRAVSKNNPTPAFALPQAEIDFYEALMGAPDLKWPTR